MWIKLIFIEKKGFALGLALKQMRKATQKWPIVLTPPKNRVLLQTDGIHAKDNVRPGNQNPGQCSHVSLFKVF